MWITSARSAILCVIVHCYDCRRQHAYGTQPQMSVLPERFPADRPFPFGATELDVSGPFASKTANEYHKRYALIFICLTTRAVHLEMYSDVSTAATINAFRLFSLAVEPLYFSYQTAQRILSPPTMIYNSSSRVHHFRTSWQTRKSNGSLFHHTHLTSVEYGSASYGLAKTLFIRSMDLRRLLMTPSPPP